MGLVELLEVSEEHCYWGKKEKACTAVVAVDWLQLHMLRDCITNQLVAEAKLWWLEGELKLEKKMMG